MRPALDRSWLRKWPACSGSKAFGNCAEFVRVRLASIRALRPWIALRLESPKPTREPSKLSMGPIGNAKEPLHRVQMGPRSCISRQDPPSRLDEFEFRTRWNDERSCKTPQGVVPR